MALIPYVKIMPARAATSSKMSQSPSWTQNRGPVSVLIDTGTPNLSTLEIGIDQYPTLSTADITVSLV